MAGEVDQMKGRMKQAAGDLTDDDKLKAEGKADEAGGKIKDAVDDAIENVKEGAQKAMDAARSATR
ncbi:MAG: CsbD family protein [Acidimicrobiales bacterium]